MNFDLDFMDGLVLAAVLAAHCPFLVSPLHHFKLVRSPGDLMHRAYLCSTINKYNYYMVWRLMYKTTYLCYYSGLTLQPFLSNNNSKQLVFHSQVNSHLRNMFLHPTTAEQCLHNALQVVEAFKVVHLDYDVVVRRKL